MVGAEGAGKGDRPAGGGGPRRAPGSCWGPPPSEGARWPRSTPAETVACRPASASTCAHTARARPQSTVKINKLNKLITLICHATHLSRRTALW